MKYDIIIIGAGSGGLNISGFMNNAGFKTLLIDRSDENIGGDCLNFGCVPSKALIHVSRLVHDARGASDFGLGVTGAVDMKTVREYIKSKQDVIRKHENAGYFRGKGIDVVLGSAEFAGDRSVAVNGTVYEGKNIVIATGSRPRELEIPGIEKVGYLTNETVFDIDYLPENFIVIGGGPIGIELGQAFQRLGSKVRVVERMDKFLPKESPEIAEVLYAQLVKEGMEFDFNTRLKEFASANELVVIDGHDNEKRLRFDAVLVSIGRVLNIEGLKLEKAGIEHEKGRIKVDERLRTTNKHVFVCGDAAGSYQFTHAAELHAGVILNNFFSPLRKKLSNDCLSWVTYTSPEIATFGLNEAELKKRGINFDTVPLDFTDDDRAIVDEATHGKLVLYISKGRIAGGSMVAEHAGELFQELALAMSSRLNVKQIFNKTYPYPTAGRINKSAILKHFSGKLTPRAKKLLHLLY
ncbi:dihydrolipoyl dehydrogenase family protein [candidate division KSB1 bacterium]